MLAKTQWICFCQFRPVSPSCLASAPKDAVCLSTPTPSALSSKQGVRPEAGGFAPRGPKGAKVQKVVRPDSPPEALSPDGLLPKVTVLRVLEEVVQAALLSQPHKSGSPADKRVAISQFPFLSRRGPRNSKRVFCSAPSGDDGCAEARADRSSRQPQEGAGKDQQLDLFPNSAVQQVLTNVMTDIPAKDPPWLGGRKAPRPLKQVQPPWTGGEGLVESPEAIGPDILGRGKRPQHWQGLRGEEAAESKSIGGMQRLLEERQRGNWFCKSKQRGQAGRLTGLCRWSARRGSREPWRKSAEEVRALHRQGVAAGTSIDNGERRRTNSLRRHAAKGRRRNLKTAGTEKKKPPMPSRA